MQKENKTITKENEKANIALLDDAYKNVRMGSYAIDCIAGKINNSDLEELLQKQNSFYLRKTSALESYARQVNYQPEDIGMMLKASSFSSINLKTLFNKDTSHIAEMLIKGTTMGITTLVKEINSHQNANEELLAICNRIVANQESFVESLKSFL